MLMMNMTIVSWHAVDDGHTVIATMLSMFGVAVDG